MPKLYLVAFKNKLGRDSYFVEKVGGDEFLSTMEPDKATLFENAKAEEIARWLNARGVNPVRVLESDKVV